MLQSDRAFAPPVGGRGHPYASGSRALRRWLTPFVLSVVLAASAGCGDDNNGPPASTATPTMPPTHTAVPSPTRTLTPVPTPTATATMALNASAACEKLATCNQCLINARGECLATDTCAGHLSSDAVQCISQLNGCNAEALGDCLQFGCSGTDADGACE